MPSELLIHVEFFGVARQRAGVAGFDVRAGRLSTVLSSIEAAFPALNGNLVGSNVYRFSLNGERFLDEDEELLPDSKLLVLSADSGG